MPGTPGSTEARAPTGGGGEGGSGASAGTDPGRGPKEAAPSPGDARQSPPLPQEAPGLTGRRGGAAGNAQLAAVAAAAGLPGRGVVKLSPRAGEPRGAGEARLRGQGRHDGRGFPALSSGEGGRGGLGRPEDEVPPRQVTQRVPHLGPAAKRPRCRRARFTRSGEAGSVRRPSPPQPQGPRPSLLLLLLLSPPPRTPRRPLLPGRPGLDPPLRPSVRARLPLRVSSAAVTGASVTRPSPFIGTAHAPGTRPFLSLSASRRARKRRPSSDSLRKRWPPRAPDGKTWLSGDCRLKTRSATLRSSVWQLRRQ